MFINIAPVQIIHGLYCDLGTLATNIPQGRYIAFRMRDMALRKVG